VGFDSLVEFLGGTGCLAVVPREPLLGVGAHPLDLFRVGRCNVGRFVRKREQFHGVVTVQQFVRRRPDGGEHPGV
jgi:hypothetical protein